MTRFARGPVVKKERFEKSTPWRVMNIDEPGNDSKSENESRKGKNKIKKGTWKVEEIQEVSYGEAKNKVENGKVNKVKKNKRKVEKQSESDQFSENSASLANELSQNDVKCDSSGCTKLKKKKKPKHSSNAMTNSCSSTIEQHDKPVETADSVNVEKSEEQMLKREWKNLKRTEKRQENRQRVATDKRVCFNCRQPGHTLAECSETANTVNKLKQCYKCGSTEHTSHSCKVKVAQGSYPFAACFICCEVGHIAAQCPDNPRGVYPNGGACKLCGSVEHLAKDCPTHLSKLGIGNKTLRKIHTKESVEVDVESDDDCSACSVRKKPKVAKF